jgi:hypothetical protein
MPCGIFFADPCDFRRHFRYSQRCEFIPPDCHGCTGWRTAISECPGREVKIRVKIHQVERRMDAVPILDCVPHEFAWNRLFQPNQ